MTALPELHLPPALSVALAWLPCAQIIAFSCPGQWSGRASGRAPEDAKRKDSGLLYGVAFDRPPEAPGSDSTPARSRWSGRSESAGGERPREPKFIPRERVPESLNIRGKGDEVRAREDARPPFQCARRVKGFRIAHWHSRVVCSGIRPEAWRRCWRGQGWCPGDAASRRT